MQAEISVGQLQIKNYILFGHILTSYLYILFLFQKNTWRIDFLK